MSDIKATAEAARNLAKQYQSVLAIQAVLDKIGDIENYIEGAAREREAIRVELVNLQASRDAAEIELARSTVAAHPVAHWQAFLAAWS